MTTAKTAGIDALLHRHFAELVDATFANLLPDAVAELVELIGEDEYHAWFDETFPEDAETLADRKEKYLAVEAKISEEQEHLLWCYMCGHYKPRAQMGDVACKLCENGG